MDAPGRPNLIDFSDECLRRRGIGFEQMRAMRVHHRRGYIACTRMVTAQALQQKTGRREPHW
jgi:hypothetical protein